jgi:hypothetical protein
VPPNNFRYGIVNDISQQVSLLLSRMERKEEFLIEISIGI